jgi:hypothetical protein
LGLAFQNAFHKGSRKFFAFVRQLLVFDKMLERACRGVSSAIDFVKGLQSNFTSLASNFHKYLLAIKNVTAY